WTHPRRREAAAERLRQLGRAAARLGVDTDTDERPDARLVGRPDRRAGLLGEEEQVTVRVDDAGLDGLSRVLGHQARDPGRISTGARSSPPRTGRTGARVSLTRRGAGTAG